MSQSVIFYINERSFSEAKYIHFMNECTKIRGNWQGTETHSFDGELCNCYIDIENGITCQMYHEFQLFGYQNNDEINGQIVNVWVHLYNECFNSQSMPIKNYSKLVDIETSMSRSLLALAIQFIIPIKAFEIFKDIIVYDESNDNIYKSLTEYKQFAKDLLINKFPFGLLAYYAYFYL
jgi:hypothetical protein